MKNILLDMLSSRIFQITALACLLFMSGVYFYTRWDSARMHSPESTIPAPVTEKQSEVSPSYIHGNFPHEHPTWIGPPPHQFSDEEFDRLDTFRSNILLGVDSGVISNAEAKRLVRRQTAILATQGMPAFEAAQYIINSPNIPFSQDYVKELADQALAENPDDPEVLYLWAGRHPHVEEGPNPEAEAAYEKLLAMEDLPPEFQSTVLDSFAGTIWYYNPEDAVRYAKEARSLSNDSSYHLIGDYYQRLGEYDKALEVYRDYYAKTGDWIVAHHIRAIEAGTPNILPISRPVTETSIVEDPTSTLPSEVPEDIPTGEFADTFPFGDGDTLTPESLQESERARAAAEAKAAFVEMQAAEAKAFRQFILQEFPEYRELLEEPTELRKAIVEMPGDMRDTPGGVQGTPGISEEQIQNAMQIFKQYGPAVALRRLRATDPTLAREIEKRLPQQ